MLYVAASLSLVNIWLQRMSFLFRILSVALHWPTQWPLPKQDEGKQGEEWQRVRPAEEAIELQGFSLVAVAVNAEDGDDFDQPQKHLWGRPN